jgi:drug/metabolite transporter (DMT)-like permease
MLMRLAPFIFVILWSTGFIGSKLGAKDAEPFTFLSLRFLIVLALMAPVAIARGALGRGARERGHALVVGMLIHGAYLGGVFWAIRNGMPAGMVALVVSLQPIVTSVLAGPLLGETVTARAWAGLVLGLAGAGLVVAPKIAGAGPLGVAGLGTAPVVASVVALAGMTAGTLYQKRFAGGIDLIAGAVWQYAGALLVVGLGAILTETREVTWSPDFIVALAWLVLVLSIGAISLLMLLIRQNAVSSVSGLFYLVPATTAVMAYLLFGESLAPVQLVGLVLATVAVLLIGAPSRAAGQGPARSRT